MRCRATPSVLPKIQFYAKRRSGTGLAGEHSERFVMADYSLASRARFFPPSSGKRLSKGAYFWYIAQDSLQWLVGQDILFRRRLRRLPLRPLPRRPSPLRIILGDAHNTEGQSARRGSSSLQRNDDGDVNDTTLHNIDNSWKKDEPLCLLRTHSISLRLHDVVSHLAAPSPPSIITAVMNFGKTIAWREKNHYRTRGHFVYPYRTDL